MNSELQAVCWDFGGVLTSSPFEAFNRFEAEEGLPKDFLRGVNAVNPEDNAWARLEANRMTPEAFDAAFAAETRARGHEVRGKRVLRLLGGELRPGMVALLKAVKRHYRVACLTNNVRFGSGPGMQRQTRRADAVREVMALFELVVESSRIGLRKPDPEFYLHACRQLRLAPEQVAFLDDLGVNLKPARALGMHTIKVLGEAQARRDLERLLQLRLS